MPPKFEHQQKEIHEAILSGEIGCAFAPGAARKGEIAYCKLPRKIDPERSSRAYVDALKAFAKDKTKTVLIGILEGELSPDEVDDYAFELLGETIIAMMDATVELIEEALVRGADLTIATFEHVPQDRQGHRLLVKNLLRNPSMRESLRSGVPGGGMLMPTIFREVYERIVGIFPFVMHPHYAEVNGENHTRYSPHFLLLLNDLKALHDAIEKFPQLSEATQRWTEDIFGYSYAQAYLLPQKPHEAESQERQDWHPRD